MLIGQYRSDPDRLAAMVLSTAFAKVEGPEGWRDLALDYPEQPLPEGKMTKYENEDVPVRAFILKQALSSLLDLADAPEAMKADLSQLLDSFLVNPAVGRAKAQAARLADPDGSWQTIAEESDGYAYRQLLADKKSWDIAHNLELVRSTPNSSS